MIALLQRVSEASVTVGNERVGAIGSGVLVFLGVVDGDTEDSCRKLADKVANFRILAGDDGRPQRSLLDTTGAGVLVVSQFTLAADTRKGRRADYGRAAAPETARELYELFVATLAAAGIPTATGRFGASMQVALVNDGPVTFWLEAP